MSEAVFYAALALIVVLIFTDIWFNEPGDFW